MEKEKTRLPGLIYLFCVSLVFSLIFALPRFAEVVELLSVFQNTAYFGLACFDAGVFITEVAMFIAMLVLIAMRKRAFLICFWIDYASRVSTLAVILLFGGQIGSSWTVLVWPTIWAFYFYLSVKVSAAFSPYRKPLFREVTAPAAAEAQVTDAEQENTQIAQG